MYIYRKHFKGIKIILLTNNNLIKFISNTAFNGESIMK